MNRSKAVRLACWLCLVVFVASGVMLIMRLAEFRAGEEFYEQVGKGRASAPPVLPPDPPPAGAAGQETEKAPAELSELSVHLLQVHGEYPDAAAWLQIPGTPVDYPVMLGEDNQFYLNHLPDGNENALGSLFFDCRTDENSRHLIVYGHNGSRGRMFGALKQYEIREYGLSHGMLTMAAADAVYTCPIFSVRRVAADSGAYTLEFEDQDGLAVYIRQAAAESLYSMEVDPGEAAGILTLSTCTGRSDQRLLVQAMIPDAPGGSASRRNAFAPDHGGGACPGPEGENMLEGWNDER